MDREVRKGDIQSRSSIVFGSAAFALLVEPHGLDLANKVVTHGSTPETSRVLFAIGSLGSSANAIISCSFIVFLTLFSFVPSPQVCFPLFAELVFAFELSDDATLSASPF